MKAVGFDDECVWGAEKEVREVATFLAAAVERLAMKFISLENLRGEEQLSVRNTKISCGFLEREVLMDIWSRTLSPLHILSTQSPHSLNILARRTNVLFL